MKLALQSRLAGLVAIALATTASAQTNLPGNVAGSTPGTGMISLDQSSATPAAATPMPAGSALQTPQPAETLGHTDGPWAVVAPYGWIFGIKGGIGVGQRNVQVNESVSDAFDAAKSSLKGAAQLHLESGYGPVGLIADLTYLKIQPATGPATVNSQTTIFELLGMYRLVNTGSGAGGVTFDILGGARYYRFSNEISGSAFGFLSAERTNKWIDLVVGARAGVQLTDNVGLFLRGDIGGFGIGQSSQQACNVVAGFDWKLCESASFLGGYRWLKIDRENGVGADRFAMDATMAGPFLAFALRF